VCVCASVTLKVDCCKIIMPNIFNYSHPPHLIRTLLGEFQRRIRLYSTNSTPTGGGSHLQKRRIIVKNTRDGEKQKKATILVTDMVLVKLFLVDRCHIPSDLLCHFSALRTESVCRAA